MPKHKYLLFNKPYGVLSQFTDGGDRPTLKKYIPIPEVYPCGRLDFDSEGLMLLSNDGIFQRKISDPKHKTTKTYIAQVEGIATQDQINALSTGVVIEKIATLPAKAEILQTLPIRLWERSKPIRFRKNIPTSWIKLSISEGRNRQVRKMTAAVGLPCLRLIRISIGDFHLERIAPGEYINAEAGAVNKIVFS